MPRRFPSRNRGRRIKAWELALQLEMGRPFPAPEGASDNGRYRNDLPERAGAAGIRDAGRAIARTGRERAEPDD